MEGNSLRPLVYPADVHSSQGWARWKPDTQNTVRAFVNGGRQLLESAVILLSRYSTVLWSVGVLSANCCSRYSLNFVFCYAVIKLLLLNLSSWNRHPQQLAESLFTLTCCVNNGQVKAICATVKISKIREE